MARGRRAGGSGQAAGLLIFAALLLAPDLPCRGAASAAPSSSNAAPTGSKPAARARSKAGPGAKGSSKKGGSKKGGAKKPAPARKGSKRRKAKRKYYHYKHSVLRGEVLGEIARRYGVRVRDVQRWNNLPGSTIRAGQALHIYTPHAVRQRRVLAHRVKRGESLIRIARKYKMEPKKLRRLNRVSDPRKLRIGQVLKVVVEGPEITSVSRGTPQAGKLLHGEQLPPGPGYHICSRGKAWGTNRTITRVIQAFRKMSKRFGGHVLAIGDISRKGGGYFPPHVSHQNGRDVDIAFYVKGSKVLKRLRRVRPTTIDAKRTWALLEAFIEGGGLQYAFIDYGLQGPLYEEALRSGWSRKRLAKVFQHPRGRGAGAIIMHEKGHSDHMHLRFEE